MRAEANHISAKRLKTSSPTSYSPSAAGGHSFDGRKTDAGQVSILSVLGCIAVCALLSTVMACPLYNPAAFIDSQKTAGGGSGGSNPGSPAGILSTATQVTLLWDPSASGSSTIVSYKISYRAHGSATWNVLNTIPATSTPSYVVLRSAIGPGSFDFAVSAVDSGGTESPLHTSLDPTADPTSGWYLTW